MKAKLELTTIVIQSKFSHPTYNNHLQSTKHEIDRSRIDILNVIYDPDSDLLYNSMRAPIDDKLIQLS